MDIIKSYGRDHSKVEEGVKIPLDAEGAYVTLRHRSAQAVQKALDNLTQEERLLWDSNEISRGKGREVFAKVLSQGAVVDWGGLTEGGKTLKYSQEAARKVLSDPKYDGFLELILDRMTNDSLFGFDPVEEDAGNSAGPSDSS